MTKEKRDFILEYFNDLYPDVKGELLYTTDYELLIAVVLSAQATDKQVNIVTANLFNDHKSLASLLFLTVSDFEHYFRSLGLFRNKAKHVYELIRLLAENYKGKVPSAKEELLKLPGVGIKTANVVRAELFNIPEIAVDTHVSRVSKRLGFASFTDNVTIIEQKLRKALPAEYYIKAHHQMIHFGRYFCKAQNPNCKECRLVKICREKNKNL